MLPKEKDLDNILRQVRMLELEYQLKLEQWSAWRRGKATGVPEFDCARCEAGQLAVGRGFGRRRARWQASLAGLKP
ncbi:MAG: hypothetical protein ACLQOO_26175 [Terriglobia bacterium]